MKKFYSHLIEVERGKVMRYISIYWVSEGHLQIIIHVNMHIFSCYKRWDPLSFVHLIHP